jgi:hypothetical protein
LTCSKFLWHNEFRRLVRQGGIACRAKTDAEEADAVECGATVPTGEEGAMASSWARTAAEISDASEIAGGRSVVLMTCLTSHLLISDIANAHYRNLQKHPGRVYLRRATLYFYTDNGM